MDAEITVGAGEYKLAKALCDRFPKLTKAIQLDVNNTDALDRAVSEHDVIMAHQLFTPYCCHMMGTLIPLRLFILVIRVTRHCV